MPVYERTCRDSSCTEYGRIVEYYTPRFTKEDPPCAVCAGPSARIISRFGIIWTGSITARYNDKRAENPEKDGGHWAWRRRSSISGQPEPVFISDFSQQKDFCKQEGLVNPRDLPTNAEPSSDGTQLQSRGMPGAWV